MKNYSRICLITGLLYLFLGSCAPKQVAWKEEFHRDISLLGHRNWIVITDMAYPLQSQPGIKTYFTGTSYPELLSFVKTEIDQAAHIKANVYQDQELTLLDESNASGITALRKEIRDILGDRLQYIPHEQLISRLDSISRVFNVIILKSDLTISYTSVFFELDCRYWDDTRQKELDKRSEAKLVE